MGKASKMSCRICSSGERVDSRHRWAIHGVGTNSIRLGLKSWCLIRRRKIASYGVDAPPVNTCLARRTQPRSWARRRCTGQNNYGRWGLLLSVESSFGWPCRISAGLLKEDNVTDSKMTTVVLSACNRRCVYKKEYSLVNLRLLPQKIYVRWNKPPVSNGMVVFIFFDIFY
jgi:hypothetical protein